MEHMGIYKKPRPFNHIFGGDRILRAWYRGIKNAGPRKRAQGRAQDIPYHRISPYHHGIWRILNVAKNTTRARARKGETQGVLSYQKSNRNFRQPPYGYTDITTLGRIWYTETTTISKCSRGDYFLISFPTAGSTCFIVIPSKKMLRTLPTFFKKNKLLKHYVGALESFPSP